MIIFSIQFDIVEIEEEVIANSPIDSESLDFHGTSDQKDTGTLNWVASGSVEGLIDNINPSKDSIKLVNLQDLKTQSFKNKTNERISKSNLQEEVDELMNHLIEINSNTKIREEHVQRFTLKFLDGNMEIEVYRIKMFKKYV